MGERIYDVGIIGGGIVGLATAMALVKAGVHSIVVLEAEDKLAAHQTGNNSGVIHSGLYYKPGSLKALNCVAGREALYRFCRGAGDRPPGLRQAGRGHAAGRAGRPGRPGEKGRRQRAEKAAPPGCRRTARSTSRTSPASPGCGWGRPASSITRKVCEAYAAIIRAGGGEIRLNFRVQGFARDGGELRLSSDGDEVRCRSLVNCAGLQSDRVARLCGVRPGLQIIPFRGEYYELVPGRHDLVRNLIYPVPDPNFPFLGVHFTRMIGGGVEAGPNAVLAFKRHGYRKTSFSLRDAAQFALYPGFWAMGLKFWKMGLGEFYRSFSKGAFVRALQRLVPEIQADDLVPGGAGVRAQALEANGFLVDDFRIREAERMVHVLNAPSPAATASISIGESIAAIALKNFAAGTPAEERS